MKVLRFAFAVTLTFATLLQSTLASDFLPPAPGKRRFLVTAYYSPLPDQQFYFRGDFEAEKRFNGNGTNGADGTPVFPGMIAAPQNFPFGTKIFIPSLGTGAVHDRGGRIIANENYDRIDVWTGHGELGLARALCWGARFVEGEILANGNAVPNISFAGFDERCLQNALKNLPVARFAKNLQQGDSGAAVRDLQGSLIELGFLPPDFQQGEFDKLTRQAVVNFQLAFSVLANESANGAGMFGPRTRAQLRQELVAKKQREQKAREIFTRLFPTMSLGEESLNVKRLQIILQDLGFLLESPTGAFDQETERAVLNFQMAHGIVPSQRTPGAGNFGPKTRAKLLAILESRRQKIAAFSQKADLTSFGNAKQRPAPKQKSFAQAGQQFAQMTFNLGPQ